jgi:hypothetical protein
VGITNQHCETIMAETHEERSRRHAELRESIAARLQQQYPGVTFNRHKFGIDVIHYVVHYSDGIHVGTRKRGINTTVFSLDNYFLTEAAAKQAITKHLAAAQAKFEKCLKAFKRLQQVLSFDVSYTVEGDTHGIEDHPIISFKEGGFDFTYTIEQ